MNRWQIYAMGLVIALLTGVSLSSAQIEGTEENEIGIVAEEETVAEMPAPEDEGVDALLLDEEMTMFQLIMIPQALTMISS